MMLLLIILVHLRCAAEHGVLCAGPDCDLVAPLSTVTPLPLCPSVNVLHVLPQRLQGH